MCLNKLDSSNSMTIRRARFRIDSSSDMQSPQDLRSFAVYRIHNDPTGAVASRSVCESVLGPGESWCRFRTALRPRRGTTRSDVERCQNVAGTWRRPRSKIGVVKVRALVRGYAWRRPQQEPYWLHVCGPSTDVAKPVVRSAGIGRSTP
jgi:hypothetical protein